MMGHGLVWILEEILQFEKPSICGNICVRHCTHLDVGLREGTFDGILVGSRLGLFDNVGVCKG